MSQSANSGGIVRNTKRAQRTKDSGQRQVGRRSATRQTVRAGSLGPSDLPMLRTSERSTFKRCHWKWWQEFHELVKPKIDVPPLRFGGLIHEALGAYYKPGIRRGPHPALTFEQVYERDLTEASGATKAYSKPEIDQIWAEHRDLGNDMLHAYIDKYGKDEEWRVIVTEFPFRTIVQRPNGTPWFWYTGILDGVWENRSTKRKVIPDHKTTKAIVLGYLQMDEQATSYWTFGVDALFNARLLEPGEKLDGMLFNFLRKAKQTTKTTDAEGFVRNKPKKQDYIDQIGNKRGFDPKWKLDMMAEFALRLNYQVLGEVSKTQPSDYHARVPIYRDWYEREGAKLRVIKEYEDMERVELEGFNEGAFETHHPPLAAYKNAGQFTCAGCWALDICELHEIGQDWMELRDMTTRKWDPYAAHEIKEGR